MKYEHEGFLGFFIVGVAFVLLFTFVFITLSTGTTGLLTGNAVFKDNTPFPDSKSGCTDSDGGIYSLVAGNITYRAGGAYLLTDTCRDREWGRAVVVEYYCRDDKVRIINIPCKYGCKKGACFDSYYNASFK